MRVDVKMVVRGYVTVVQQPLRTHHNHYNKGEREEGGETEDERGGREIGCESTRVLDCIRVP